MTTTLVQNEWLNDILLFVIYLAACLILLWVGKVIFRLVKSSIHINDELTEKDNPAFAVSYTGYFAGLILAVGSAVYGPSNGLVTDLIDMAIFGGIAIVLLNLSSVITDKVVLRKFSVWKEIITDRNVGTGVIEGANYLTSGLIIFGAITGESGHLLFGIYTALAYWAIGQVLIIITEALYNKLVPYDVHHEIERDNVAAGIGFAGAMIAMGILIKHALMGNFESWDETLLEVAYEAGLGLIILPLMRTLVDRILLPGKSLSSEITQEKPNIGASFIEALGYIGGAVLIIWCI